MLMHCEKTGAQVVLDQYDCMVRGDVYMIGNVLIMRVNNRSRAASYPLKHYTIHNVQEWFDETKETGTIICTNFTSHGYEGVPTNAT